ncbi:MAG: class I SAM-dependent methyltransferase [Chloroflexaceae bacterium]|jgi:ubiquinone/menaquinone biosynthesis C-methylase UbiE|nr:class I SAM-dependent methyltransferase [Chloroflexaceae bacterium]
MSDASVNQSIQQQFGAVAANYTTSAVHASGADLQGLIAATALTGRERVIDVGCGAGHVTVALAPKAHHITAVDLTQAMLDQTTAQVSARGYTNVSTHRADVAALPFADAAFDVAVSRYAAHHFADPLAALREVRRVLVPGGRWLLVDVVSPPSPMADTYLNTVEILRDPSHVRDHSVAQWLEMCAQAGFVAQHVQTWSVRLEFTSWVTRMATPEPEVAQLRRLMANAPAHVRDVLGIEADSSFHIAVALITGVRQ